MMIWKMKLLIVRFMNHTIQIGQTQMKNNKHNSKYARAFTIDRDCYEVKIFEMIERL